MKKKFRTIIIDDERLARKDLRTLLAEFENIEIIDEADSVTAAAQLIKKADPDLIFLDIQMPGESGFDLLEKVDTTAHVIFVTAFDEYAIRAFEVDAIDYLLKPVNPDRLRKTIERLETIGAGQAGSKRHLTIEDTLFITFNSHPKFLKINSIVCVLAAGDYSEVITSEGKKGLVQKSMSEWEERLPDSHFSRIHRSTIVNFEHIIKIEEWFNNAYRVYMKGIDTPLDMSRRYAAKLKEKLG
jgi:two-component system, LytTR family, response regulator